MNLYRVHVEGALYSTGRNHTVAYVAAEDPTHAYNVYKKYLDDNDIMFPRQRELVRVDLLASSEAISKPLFFPLGEA